jgi:hypothetical protein
MIFKEQKIKNGYKYELNEIFGDLTLESSIQLQAEVLDELVVLLLKQKTKSQEIVGEVKNEDGEIKYKFVKRSLWEDDKNETCKNTPTSIQKTAKEYIVMFLLKIRIINYLQRFVRVFLIALRNSK